MIKSIRIIVEGYWDDKDGRTHYMRGSRIGLKPDDDDPPLKFESLAAFLDFIIETGEYDEITLIKKHTVTERVINSLKGR
jgi:hypothetical protein